MLKIPHARAFDSTLALVRDPYHFISNECRAARSDAIRARILFQSTVLVTGEGAARMFCDIARLARKGAAPIRLQKSLFGVGGVQGLDDDEHRHRKAMFMSLMTRERIECLQRDVETTFIDEAQGWAHRSELVFYDAMLRVLTRSVCKWSGVPLDPAETELRTSQLAALFDGAGAIGPRHWAARSARAHSERWIAHIIQRIRSHGLHPPPETAAHRIAWHRTPEGELLEPRIAAVELLNVLRPTVAVAVYAVFIAHALHQFPKEATRVASGRMEDEQAFVQEVRRWYPFFPAVVARVRQPFEWQGYRFEEGERVMLDLYGTNHDPRLWEEPDVFSAARFAARDIGAFDLIPQGPGDHWINHRCPGEWITIGIMETVLRLLRDRVFYRVPEQDYSLDYTRLPALPRSRWKISDVRVQ